MEFAFNILYESEASVDKTSEGEIVVVLLRTLSNTVYGSLRLALWVKFDNQKDQYPLKYIKNAYQISYKILFQYQKPGPLG